MPEYQIIGNSFLTGLPKSPKMHFGPVVASRYAFYLVVNISHNQALFGLLGGLVDTIDGGVDSLASVTVTTVANLPDAVTSHSDWPRKVIPKRTVIVLSRAAVQSVKRVGAQLHVDTENGRFALFLKFFGRSRIADWLHRPLKWLS